MMLLFIDTSDFNNLRLAIITNNKVNEFFKKIAFNENFKTNELLQKFLIKHKVPMKDLNKIVVCSGPGSFTGIRVGVSLAQALGFALNIPVIAITKRMIPKDLEKLNAIRSGKPLMLHYGQKPNITTSKQK